MQSIATLCLAAAVSAVNISETTAAAHTPAPCMKIPSTQEAWTIFKKVDANNDNTIDLKELEAAAKALDDLHAKADASYDPALVQAIKDKVKSFLAKHNGAIPLSRGVLGLQRGIAELNAHTEACVAKDAKVVDVAQAAIAHFKMFTPFPCVSVPEHGDAQVIFKHVDGIDFKDGQVTKAEMDKAVMAVEEMVKTMNHNFNPAIGKGAKKAIDGFFAKHNGSVNEEEGVEGLQDGMRMLNDATGSCAAVGQLNGVESVNLAQMAIKHFRMLDVEYQNAQLVKRTFGNTMNGFCVKSNGADENAHVKKLYGGDVHDAASWMKCEVECAKQKNATGCEAIWNQGNRGCYVHFSHAITKANGVDRHFCALAK